MCLVVIVTNLSTLELQLILYRQVQRAPEHNSSTIVATASLSRQPIHPSKGRLCQQLANHNRQMASALCALYRYMG